MYHHKSSSNTESKYHPEVICEHCMNYSACLLFLHNKLICIKTDIYYHAAVWLRHRFAVSEIIVLVRSLLMSESWGSLQRLLLFVDCRPSVPRGCWLSPTCDPLYAMGVCFFMAFRMESLLLCFSQILPFLISRSCSDLID